MTIEVNSELVQGEINKSIDDAFRMKYGQSPYLSSMISNSARSATVELLYRD
ncbi:MAG: DUF2255 family protein [Chitinophagaceae bacterium]|nr:DUF2255 family protein [Chitinophagaceae bacterium]